jgi:hypothetical protein
MATVRLGAASGNGFALRTATISATVRTITATGLPAYAASARSKVSLTSDALLGLSKSRFPLAMYVRTRSNPRVHRSDAGRSSGYTVTTVHA